VHHFILFYKPLQFQGLHTAAYFSVFWCWQEVTVHNQHSLKVQYPMQCKVELGGYLTVYSRKHTQSDSDMASSKDNKVHRLTQDEQGSLWRWLKWISDKEKTLPPQGLLKCRQPRDVTNSSVHEYNGETKTCFWFARSRGSSGSIVSDYRLDDRGLIPDRGREVFFWSLRPDRLWCPTSLLSNGYRGSFPQG
jgi:hypothetical protein